MAEPDAGETVPRAAAILDDGQGAEALLASIVRRRREAGWQVRGLLAVPSAGERSCATEMLLRDLDTLEDYLVSQPLGSQSNACRADPQGFARASAVLRRAADEAPDLVVSNRFGRLEAEGGGFRAELLELMLRDLPLLTLVGPRHAAAWREFTGGAPVLPAQAEVVERWLASLEVTPA